MYAHHRVGALPPGVAAGSEDGNALGTGRGARMAHGTSVDMASIARRVMEDSGIDPDFSPEALAQADRASPPSAARIEDLRDLPWSSIDNHESKDLDQVEVTDAL